MLFLLRAEFIGHILYVKYKGIWFMSQKWVFELWLTTHDNNLGRVDLWLNFAIENTRFCVMIGLALCWGIILLASKRAYHRRNKKCDSDDNNIHQKMYKL